MVLAVGNYSLQLFLRFYLLVKEGFDDATDVVFQLFLRFYTIIVVTLNTPQRGQVSTLLEILAPRRRRGPRQSLRHLVSTLLEILGARP